MSNRQFVVRFQSTLEDKGIDSVSALRATLKFAQGRFGLRAVSLRGICFRGRHHHNRESNCCLSRQEE